MKFPFFATAILITIFCFMMFIKSIDYGQAWAIVLSIVGLLTFGILSLVALLYQMRQHEDSKGNH
jgi:cell division protein FtsW (lipid II flippase)